MSKELNIIEAVNMPVGTEFDVIDGITNSNKKAYVVNTRNGIYGNKLSWDKDGSTDLLGCASNLNAKFILVHKPVSFQTAIEAFDEGKDIYCISKIDNHKHIYKRSPKSRLLTDQHDNTVSSYEILHGKWYIEEE